MYFDDRLDTVLRLPATSAALLRIQYRQLLDLLGSTPASARSDRIEAAYQRLAELSTLLPAPERADMLRPSLARLRNSRLLAHLAEDDPRIASAAIAAAELDEAEWLALIPKLPIRARGILRHRRGLGPCVEALLDRLGVSDRALPPAQDVSQIKDDETDAEPPLDLSSFAEEELSVETAHPPPDAEPSGDAPSQQQSEIAALLRRIETFNRNRRTASHSVVTPSDAPRLPFDDSEDPSRGPCTAPFDFATDAEGRIIWADDGLAPMVVGMRIAAGEEGNPGIRPDAAYAFRRRQPLCNVAASLRGAPAISGDWRIDATPLFDPALGHFAGYAGRFRREPFSPGAASLPDRATGETDRIRQILHELRTPANTIQMAAEIIQQNLFGTTPHEYRAIAAMIASDIAYVLAGFDELERLAKLEGHAMNLAEGQSDIVAVTAAIVEQLEAFTAPRSSGFVLDSAIGPMPVRLSREDAERLVWRLLAVLAGEAAPGEVLKLDCHRNGDHALLVCQLPASLAATDEESLFHATRDAGSSVPRPVSAGMFGTGFSLRLARAEARAAGGWLKRDGNLLRLMLPLDVLDQRQRES